MAAMSNWLENQIIDYLFRSDASGFSFTYSVSNLYLALCSATPTDASTGSAMNEISGTGYARIAVLQDYADWFATDLTTNSMATSNSVVGTSGSTGNTNAAGLITWIAGSNWGTVTSIAICDASSSGNLWFYGDLASPLTIHNGDTFSLYQNQLQIQIDN